MWCFQAFNEIGGYQELESRYPEAKPALTSEGNWTAPVECFMPRADAFHIFRDPITGDIPWPGVIFGLSTISLYYWCTDQVTRHAALRGLRRGGRGLEVSAATGRLPSQPCAVPRCRSTTRCLKEVSKIWKSLMWHKIRRWWRRTSWWSIG